MRFLAALIGVVALCGPVAAVAHEHDDEHEGCCCRHGRHHSHDESAKSTPDKAGAKAQAQEKKAPKSPAAEKPAPSSPK